VLCIDDPEVRHILPEVTRRVVTYGFGPDADIRAHDITQDGVRNHFRVSRRDQENWLEVTLNLPGRHNVLNSLAAIAVAHDCGVDDVAICRALEVFKGVGRRFQLAGEIETAHGRVLLVDDYGHHPREVAAVIQAARAAWPERRLVVAFQPHRYTRTRDLFDDFSEVLSSVDALVMLEVYAAGEEPIPGADSRTLCRSIRARGQVDPVHVAHVDDLPQALQGVLHDGDVLITLGAGDIGAASSKLPEQLAKGAQ